MPAPFPTPEKAWWKEASIYQIYPASFCDSNGTGTGDLAGITSKLDYIKGLGVKCIWLCPIYESPQVDLGYDISDYKSIHSPYGTLDNFETLLKETHARGMKLIMDLVVNHCSDQHAWFKAARSSKTDPKRDWFYWKKGVVDSESGKLREPNNWRSVFGGSAWTYDEKTEEYFLRLFCPEQPDLNWENKEVREAVYETMRWWLDKGVDGFRMDVINLISKTDGLPDAKVVDHTQWTQPPFEFCANGPRVHEFLQEMNREVLSKYDCLTVGEMPFSHDTQLYIPYTLPKNNELQMVFQFEIADMDGEPESPMRARKWTLSTLKEIIGRWQVDMIAAGGWNSLYLENHDQARSITRLCSDAPEHRAIAGKLLAILHSSLSGTQYIFQGQELAQINVPRSWGEEEYKDIATRNYWNSVLEERRSKTGEENPDMSDILAQCRQKSRDNARTPMQWSPTPNAGFTTSASPWMRLHDDALNADHFQTWNVETQSADPNSCLNFWKTMIKLRGENQVLIYGNFTLLSPSDETIFAYTRQLEDQVALVVMNFSAEPTTYTIPTEVEGLEGARLLVGNAEGEGKIGEGSREVALKAWEGRIYLL
ncbi:glycoside hydrolase family 13 protein [Mrakia frigida]|uniref:glycoside hydrolase family 13 protein n=1 Tax=Mrakia frigida TaxID=29902 RepID=UPI003FCC0C4F